MPGAGRGECSGERFFERRDQPDALDSLLVVVTPRSILAFASLAGVLVIALIWSVASRIPVTVEGQGILMRPGLVTELQSTSEGRLISVQVEVGDHVSAGDLVGLLSQPTLERELNQLNAEFEIRQSFAKRQIELAERSRELERALAAEQQATIKQQIAALEDLRKSSVEQREIALTERRQRLAAMEDLLATQQAEQQERMEGMSRLSASGVISNQERLAALGEVTSSSIRAAEIGLQLSEVRLSEVTAVQERLQLTRDIEELRAELTQIEINEQKAERTFADLKREAEQSVEEVAARIRSTRQELSMARRIVSPYSGVILERFAAEGELVTVGGALAMMRLDPQSPFMRVLLSPDAQVGEFELVVNGVATGPLSPQADGETVAAAVAELPALQGFTSVAGSGQLDEGGVDITFHAPPDRRLTKLVVEIRDRDLWTREGRPATGSAAILGAHIPERPLSHVGFFPIGLGKQISPGLEIRIDPSSIERERYGSMVGRVTSVSDFAVTEEGMMQVIGISAVVKSLGGAGGVIMVEASLNEDPSNPTGLEWTSKSPDFEISEGTTTTARVVVEERRPISFVIPLLRRWLLGEGEEVRPEELAAGQRLP